MAKILVIEDGEQVSSLLLDLLDGAGHKTFHASEGKSGLDLARKEVPDLVMLDVMIPEMSGIEVCWALKSDSRTSKVRVIMMSGQDKGDIMRAAFAAGADEYILKPFDTAKLLKRVEEVLKKR